MPNASTADSRAGWEIYRSSGFRIDLDEINEQLISAGHRVVSNRTYTHYGNLANAGFSRYLPINRFDVARAAKPYESASGRYAYLNTRAGVRVTFPRGRRLVSATGQVTRIGDSGVLVIFDNPRTVAALAKNRPRRGENAGVDFIDPPLHVTGRVVDFEPIGDEIRLEIEFGELQSLTEYVGAIRLPTVRVSIRLSEQDVDTDSVDVVGRQLYYIFELMEAARALTNEASRMSGNKDYSPVVKVVKLQRASPLAVMFAAPIIVALVARAALELLKVTNESYSIRNKKYEGDERSALAEIAQSRVAVEKKKAEIELAILERISETYSEIGDSNLTKIKRLIDRDVLDIADSLSEQKVIGATVTTSDDEDAA